MKPMSLKIEGKKIYLDSQEITNVVRYELTEGVKEPAKLTLTLYVEVGEVK